MFDVALEESSGVLLGIAIDDEASTLAVDANDLDWDEAHIEVNLEGVAYDDEDVLKLDLSFARVSPVSSYTDRRDRRGHPDPQPVTPGDCAVWASSGWAKRGPVA